MTVLWMLLRPRRHSGVMTWLQIVASAVATLLSFAVVTFAVRLWEVPDESGAGSVAKIVKLEHAWRRLDGRNDDGFQVAPFPG